VLYRDQGTILRPLDMTISSARLDFRVTVSWLLCDIIRDIDDPDFLSSRHFSVRQQVFYNLELAALLVLNTSIHLMKYYPT
jgi:hypothetical protein